VPAMHAVVPTEASEVPEWCPPLTAKPMHTCQSQSTRTCTRVRASARTYLYTINKLTACFLRAAAHRGWMTHPPLHRPLSALARARASEHARSVRVAPSVRQQSTYAKAYIYTNSTVHSRHLPLTTKAYPSRPSRVSHAPSVRHC
jgi:hypothetical protein